MAGAPSPGIPWDPTSRPEPRPPPPRAAARPDGTADVRPDPIPSPIGKTFGAYRILSVMQRGGMGEIFLAEVVAGPLTGRQVVLKRLLADFDDDQRYREMFGAEAQVTMRMDHPNIVRVFDATTINDKPCLAMEFVHGRNVSQILKRCRKVDLRLPPQVALTIMLHILEALAYAHAFVLEDGTPLDLVHRDVTPGNILVSFDGAVKITDFGIAKSKMSVVSTTVGVVKGTTRYLSPEQIRSQDVDGRTDLFSAAAVLTEMLTGKPVFDRGAVPPTLFAIIKGERPPIADLLPFQAPRLAAAIERALSVSPKARFRSAGEFANALRDAQRELGRPLASNGVGRFIQELFGERPPQKPLIPAPEKKSLDLTYLFEVNDRADLEPLPEPEAAPIGNAELESELESLLVGVEPLMPDDFIAERRAPPPPPPASARIDLPTFPDHPELAQAPLGLPPPRFPPPRSGSRPTPARLRPTSQPRLTPSHMLAPGPLAPPPPDEPRTEDLTDDDRPRSDAHVAILDALQEAVLAVEREDRAFEETVFEPEEPTKLRSRMRPLFLAGTLCGSLLVWGAMSFVGRVLADAPATNAPAAVVPAESQGVAPPPEQRDITLPAPTQPVVPTRDAIDILEPRGARVRIDGILLSRRVPIRDFHVEPSTRQLLITKRRYRRRVEVEIEAGQHFDVTKNRFRELTPVQTDP